MCCGSNTRGLPLNLAFLSPAWPADGAANGIVTYVDRLAAGLAKLGHRTCILTNSRVDTGLWPDVYCLGQRKRSGWARVLDAITFRLSPLNAFRRQYSANLREATERAVAERGIELLEMEETFGFLPLIKPWLRIPVVVRLHGPHFANGVLAANLPKSAEVRQRVRQEGRGISQADAISAPSREILERTRAYYGIPLAGASVIPPPAPIVPPERRWRLADCDRRRILFVGRFDRHKGGDIVIDSLRKIMCIYPDVRVWFVGSEAEFVDDQGKCWTMRKYLAERAREVADSIDWMGRQPDAAVDALRRRAFLTVVASRYETFGLVALEAMAHGCPLIATRIGGIPETVADGVSGLLCQAGDANDMADKMTRLFADPELAARLGHQAGEDGCTRYHPDLIAHTTAAFHQTVLDNWHASVHQ